MEGEEEIDNERSVDRSNRKDIDPPTRTEIERQKDDEEDR